MLKFYIDGRSDGMAVKIVFFLVKFLFLCVRPLSSHIENKSKCTENIWRHNGGNIVYLILPCTIVLGEI